MEHLDTLFMMVGVVYSCYVVVAGLVRLDYQVRKHRRT